MANIFIVSDTHFGHEATWRYFKDNDGNPLRPFTSTEEMDETMVENWNKVVKPSDKVYHLGDVTMRKPNLEIVKRLNGHKRLVRGNHDIFATKAYVMVGLSEIYGVRVLDNMVFTHIPIHVESIGRWALGNVHGHLHINKLADPRYLNVSVEQINYTPLSLEEVKQRLKAQQ